MDVTILAGPVSGLLGCKPEVGEIFQEIGQNQKFLSHTSLNEKSAMEEKTPN